MQIGKGEKHIKIHGQIGMFALQNVGRCRTSWTKWDVAELEPDAGIRGVAPGARVAVGVAAKVSRQTRVLTSSWQIAVLVRIDAVPLLTGFPEFCLVDFASVLRSFFAGFALLGPFFHY